jgi:hypothetical protein
MEGEKHCEPFKWVASALNSIFLFLKNHKGNTIIWIVNIFILEHASLIAKFQCSKFDANQESFCKSKTFKPLE